MSSTSATPTPIRIDFVSDVSCPWCVIGLKSLEQALGNLQDSVQAEIHFQPFELNASMPAEGEDIGEHIARKYGSTEEQMAQSREAIRARGEQLGFTFAMDKRGRIYNTFDAHRLLHWAALQGRQKELKMALFDAYFTQGQNPSSHAVLLTVAGDAGLDTAKAAEVLASNAYADEVRAQEQFYQQNGINSVPAVIINERHLISGGQPPEVFEQALRQIIASA
ncbi:DsbA family oxidoreductase [Janthinobacterium sp. SUN118]|uniref:DsbA family oxidoreductase n=1 Tax=Janthinobacterium sp. SUN118 TaxID=3004100 RepID=UPI0025B03458|nr:DsbA family oxidoreductase [Janthinobacterium sp. SUN118]MDN2708385.1 DsbA family oxidoreductase [Janthinobacterium sp. SUN118]